MSRFIFYYICPATIKSMKKLITASILATALFGFQSCEKCASCVTAEDDPNALSETRTTEICGRGRNYTDQVTIFERSNWECTEN
jgi:hypothetical protein